MKLWMLLLLGVAGNSIATMVPIDVPSSLPSEAGKSEWSWQSEDPAVTSGSENKREIYEKPIASEVNPNANAGLVDAQPSVESVIEEILVSNRQGRNIEGYDQIYSDPDVKNALQLGNDTIARSYIRDKLCSLGLMNCENVEGRRPYYSPHRGIHPQDIIYAQPVTIKPVGRPLPAIPVKRPYGPSIKPGPLSPGFISSGPPPEVIYGSGGAPHPPSISHFPPSPGLIGSYPAYKKPGPISSFGPKPVFELGGASEGFNYESSDRFIDKKQIALRPSVGSEGVQQHVHHHYHHSEGAQGIASGSSFVPSQGSSYGSIGTTFDEVSNAGHGVYGAGFQDFDDYKKAFKVKGTSNDGNGLSGSVSTNNYADQYPVYEKPAFGKADAQKTGKYFSPGNYAPSNTVQSGFNDYTAAGSANSNNYFNSYGNGNFGNDLSVGFASDCVCVPYDQCSGEHAGRKDDLFLPLDPRNLNKDIESENATNETSTIVRVAKSSESDSAETTGQQETESLANVRTKRGINEESASIEGRKKANGEGRQYTVPGAPRACGPGYVCCPRRQPIRKPQPGQCGVRYTQGINGRIKTPSYVDGDAEFGEYPWQVAILKKDPTESVYVCGGTLISSRHILTAAHCVKTYAPHDLRVRLGEWDVNHDVEFYPYIERDVASVLVHPEFYAGTLYNDIAILRIDHDVDFQKNPHISPACLPNKREDFTRNRCWTTGWGKDAFGDFGKYQNILKEVDVPIVSNQICEQQMRRTRLGPGFNLHPGFICAGGEEGKDACKGDGGGPMVCERNGRWQLAGIVSWGIGCGQAGVPGVYSRVSYYFDWIQQILNRY
ncbi:uncharacterized protein LOC100876014 isoform X3 [Megachile rotundata]|uniref:uncharacterized protein LOC100876014 isoform X3 n=1 Tax=Megachile rotundata TaxID=143995 RepID=UPI003FD1F1A5